MQPHLNVIGKLLRLFVRKGVSEGEVGRLVLRVREHVRELQRELLVVVEEVGDFRDDSSPLLLLLGHDSVDGLEALVVELGLMEA